MLYLDMGLLGWWGLDICVRHISLEDGGLSLGRLLLSWQGNLVVVDLHHHIVLSQLDLPVWTRQPFFHGGRRGPEQKRALVVVGLPIRIKANLDRKKIKTDS
jgi:hypothetical protein